MPTCSAGSRSGWQYTTIGKSQHDQTFRISGLLVDYVTDNETTSHSPTGEFRRIPSEFAARRIIAIASGASSFGENAADVTDPTLRPSCVNSVPLAGT